MNLKSLRRSFYNANLSRLRLFRDVIPTLNSYDLYYYEVAAACNMRAVILTVLVQLSALLFAIG